VAVSTLCVSSHQHSDHTLSFFERHAAYAPGIAAHGAYIVLVKAHRLATVGEEHHIVFAVRQRGADQVVALIEIDRDDARLARVAELVERGFLDCAHRGAHEHIVIGRKAAELASQRQHHVDFFALGQREHIDDGSTP
jgi:hypothetical protein